MAVVVAGVAAVTNALGKVSLDAIIQREVPESLRASAFARSETLLQLAWVVGGALGIALPPTGWLGFTVAAALLVLAVGLVVWSLYRGSRPPRQPVAVSPDAPTRAGRAAVVVRQAAPRAAPGPARRLRQRRGRAGPARCGVEVGVAGRRRRPDPVLPGRRGAALQTTTPPIIEVSPDATISLTVPEAVAERGWSVQVFDEQLEERLGEVDVAPGDDDVRRDQHLRRRPAGLLPRRRRGQGRRLRRVLRRLADRLHPRRRRPGRDAVLQAPRPPARGLTPPGRSRRRAAPRRPCATRPGRGAGRGAAPRRRRRAA